MVTTIDARTGDLKGLFNSGGKIATSNMNDEGVEEEGGEGEDERGERGGEEGRRKAGRQEERSDDWSISSRTSFGLASRVLLVL